MAGGPLRYLDRSSHSAPIRTIRAVSGARRPLVVSRTRPVAGARTLPCAGSHHARVARFRRDHEVEAVVAHHMGDGMRHMLDKMGLTVRLGEAGSARESATTAVGGDPDNGLRPG